MKGDPVTVLAVRHRPVDGGLRCGPPLVADPAIPEIGAKTVRTQRWYASRHTGGSDHQIEVLVGHAL
jgi:hypothetical protein